MDDKKLGRLCGSYRPLNDTITGTLLSFHEQNADLNICRNCVYFSSKNCGTELSGVFESCNNFY